jgi:uncharacterized protein (UPF0332 family)
VREKLMSDMEVVDEEIEKAEKSLKDAKVLHENNGSEQAVASLLYYTCYHAAKAVLFQQDFDPKTHGGVVSLFGQHIIDSETVTREDGEFLSRSQTRREKSEYDYQPVDEDIDKLIQQTQEFTYKIKQKIKTERKNQK